MHVRRCILVAVLTVMATTSAAPARATTPPPVPDLLRAFSVLPPGQNGFFHIGDVIGETLPPHAADQYDMYAALADDDDVTDPDLLSYFKPFQFGPVGTIEREYQPIEGASVYRDGFGVPHIYAATDDAASFALGYVTAEDRLWQMDLLRHVARGELAAWLGAGYVETDKRLRRDGYTEGELQTMFDELDDRFGPDGVALQDALTDYAAGVNARMAEVRSNPALLPVEYGSRPIEDWVPSDSVAVVVLQLRQFGETAGGELRNAALYQELRRRLGKRLGAAVFSDLVRESRGAPTSIPSSEGSFPSQRLGETDPKAVAIPDRAERLLARLDRRERDLTRSLRGLVMPMPASNFLAVAPSRSTTGNSLEFGAPQVGYTIPQFFMELDVHSPTFDFRGPAVPGASLLVPLGRGIDYAWSLTTGVSDAVDVRIEDLCGANSYIYKNKCTKMEARTETIEVRGGDPVSYKIYRTVHGPVEARATVDGDPVAVVRERFFWKEEIDSVPSFMKLNSNSLDSVEEFEDVVEGFTMSFNTVYADADNIAYFHLGKYPIRADGVDPMLPSWGTGRWEWQARFPFDQHPQVIDPAQGWIANWNNKPSTGWQNGDATYWGPAHRDQLLVDEMERRTADGGKLGLSEVVDVMRIVATQDGRAMAIGDDMLDMSSGLSGTAGDALARVEAWISGGAHRLDTDRDDIQDDAPAVAIFDAWYLKLVHKVFDDELGGLYDLVGTPISDDPSVNNGSSFFSDFSNYLDRLLGSQKGLARDYCDDRRTDREETCAKLVKGALVQAVAKLTREQGDDPAAWTAPADHVNFGSIGGMDVPPIPWQNRGTWNHAVEVLGRRDP